MEHNLVSWDIIEPEFTKEVRHCSLFYLLVFLQYLNILATTLEWQTSFAFVQMHVVKFVLCIYKPKSKSDRYSETSKVFPAVGKTIFEKKTNIFYNIFSIFFTSLSSFL